MDARIAARRREVRSAQARRRRAWVTGVLLLAALAAGAFAISRSSLFAVTAVRVEGIGDEHRAELLEATGVAPGQNLATVDLEQVEDSGEALPWVAAVMARREPPATIVLSVLPRRPLAELHTADEVWQLDREGFVVAGGSGRRLVTVSADTAVAAVPGEQVDHAATLAALAVHAALPPRLARAVRGYSADRVVEATFRLRPLGAGRGAVTVRFGDQRRLGEKLRVLRAVLDDPGRGVRLDGAIIDVRAPRNPVVIPASG